MEGQGPGDNNGGVNGGGDGFPVVDDASIRRPPRRNEPRERTLTNGNIVKWCPECGTWGDHFRAEYPAEDPPLHPNDDAMVGDGLVVVDVVAEDIVEDDVSDGAFARLRLAGLL